MSVPILLSVTPGSGPAGGGDRVRLIGVGFAPRLSVRFGGTVATVLSVREEAGSGIVDVRTPAHDAGAADVELVNVDEAGAPIPGESAVVRGAYRFVRPELVGESDLTRVVRQLLRALKQQVVSEVSASISVDYDDTVDDDLGVIALAKVPSLVLSGPTLRPNRRYATNVASEAIVAAPTGPEIVRRGPALTVDLVFTITATTQRTAELLNLMAATATFLNRHPWLELSRDPVDPSRGVVRWEMSVDGEFRSQLGGGKDDTRAFTCAFVIRGFDVDEGLPFDRSKLVDELVLETEPFSGDAA